MNQIELIDAAKQQQGLTSDNQLALRLGVTRSRVSELKTMRRAADEAEIAMLADMAEIDLHIALAAVHKDREKNPAKRAYWEKISIRFAMGMMAGALVFAGFAGDAKAASGNEHSINYAKLSRWKTTIIQRFESLIGMLFSRLACFAV